MGRWIAAVLFGSMFVGLVNEDQAAGALIMGLLFAVALFAALRP